MTSKQSYHHGDLRKRLLHTAEQLVMSQGPEAITMRRLSRHIGVSHTAVYRHFRNKDELICALVEDGFNALRRRFQTVDDERYPPLERVKILGRSYVEFAFENPARYRVMFGSIMANTSRSTVQQAASKSLMCLFDVIRLGQVEGVIQPGDPLDLAGITWSMIHGLSQWLLGNPLVGWQENHDADGLSQNAERLIRTGLDNIVSGLSSSGGQN